MDFVTRELDPSLGDETSRLNSEALAYYEDATAGPEETADLDAELEDAGLDSESEDAELERFQQRDAVPSPPKVGTRRISVILPPSTLQCPRPAYEEGLSLSVSKERVAVQALLEADPTQANDQFIEFELDNFSCYIDSDRFPFEMRALHTHANRTGKKYFLLNGVLRVGDIRHYIRQVPFEEIPLGNYGREHPTVGDQLWICSKINEGKEIYYKLKNPSKEYARFHEPFLWVADLAKHVVDFSEYMIDEEERTVGFHHFKKEFGQWLWKTHGKAAEFQKWYKQRGGDDFRQSIVANQAFIRKEVSGMLGEKKMRRLHIFDEIARPFNFYKRQIWKPVQGQEHQPVRKGPPDTIVTPYVRECFSNMKLGQLLKEVEPCISTEERIKLSWPERRTVPQIRRPGTFTNHDTMIKSIKPGDLISTQHDPDDCNIWKPTKTKGNPEKEAPKEEGEVKRWYCLVQKVYTLKDGTRKFDIFWMYQPEDTPCCSMKYPYRNELFLSDHCTCHSGEGQIKDREVTGVHSVEWFGSPETTSAEFFVRQTYEHEHRRFVTLEQAHMRCRAETTQSQEYHVGDTVLVLTPGTKVLEPYELLGYLEGNQTCRLRRLLRLKQIDGQQGDCAPNALVYTEEETYASVDGIHCRCILRCYGPGEEVPVPYNLNGTGNAFIITHRKLPDGSVEPLGQDKPQIRQGFDPNSLEVNKLRALDLYCGCGNLGHGLEDGGAVEAKWANDIWDAAMHTYMANAQHPESVKPFLGSVDDLLHYGLEGRFSDAVPRPGEVDLISGGSPCPGFSLITADKTTMDQKKNRSLVASFAAYVDFYRPKYGILENVTTIVQAQGSEEDFLSQLFCAIVGMGYQAQIILGDSWAHANPQRRERAFLWFAAPGLCLPQSPQASHSHPLKVKFKNLGRLTSGEAFMRRTSPPTPFKYVSALEATADLPDIYDAKPDTCVPYPDHKLSISVSSGKMKSRAEAGDGKSMRTQLLNIPVRPYGMNFAKAWHGGTQAVPRDMFDHERDAFPTKHGSHRVSRISHGWERVHPHGLFSTITTFCHVTDARLGNWTHWDQPRPLTIMEVRRAQGIPDGEVLLGSPADQWRLVGNAVARQMATALGLTLREAWVGTLYEDGGGEGVPVPGEEGAVGGVGEGDFYSSRSQTPGLPVYLDNETSASGQAGGDVETWTPATSLADFSHNDDLVAANGAVAADSRKRPLSKALADELLAVKKPRLTPHVVYEEPEPGPEQPSSGDDDLLYLGSAQVDHQSPARWNGSTVVGFEDIDGGAAGGGQQEDDLTILGSAPAVSPPRPNGPTIVHLLSDDEEDGWL